MLFRSTRHIDTSTVHLELRKSQVFTARYSLCIDDIHVNSATIKTNRIKLNRQEKGLSSLIGLPRRRLLGRNMKHLLPTSVIDNPRRRRSGVGPPASELRSSSRAEPEMETPSDHSYFHVTPGQSQIFRLHFALITNRSFVNNDANMFASRRNCGQ